MKILVVCGAGASSTFVALRLRQAAAAHGYDWECTAQALAQVRATPADLILVGPHLAADIDAIRAETDAGVHALPDDIFSDRDGARTLALVESALTAEKGKS